MATSRARTVRLDPNDNVVVALDEIGEGQHVLGEDVVATVTIPAGHKMATVSIESGAPIRKFGQTIGFATGEITPGAQVHVHNCTYAAFERDYDHGANAKPTEFVSEERQASFMGYRRACGGVGTRNYIGVLSSVNCSATVAKHIADGVMRKGILRDYPNIDGIVALVHGSGCGMAADGEGFALLQRSLWGYARHSNFAAVMMVGLGCEVNQIPFLLEAYGITQGDTFQSLVMQEIGGTRKTIEEGIRRI